MIHHANKDGGYRGSTAMSGAVDLMLRVENNNHKLTFKVEKARDTEQQTFSATVHFEQQSGSVYLTKSHVNVTDGQYTRCQAYVISVLKTMGKATIKELTEKPSEFSQSNIRKAIYELKDKGVVYRTDSGGQGSIAVLELVEK